MARPTQDADDDDGKVIMIDASDDDEVEFEAVDVGMDGNENAVDGDGDEDEEEAWDEVAISSEHDDKGEGTSKQAGDIEIVLQKEPESAKVKARRAAKGTGVNQARERMIRHERHKLHAVCLLVSGMIRNRWICDAALKARLLSIVPISIQNSFSVITRANYPNDRDRARLFDSALKELVYWWYDYFEVDHSKSLVRRTVEEVAAELEGGWNASDFTAAKEDSPSKRVKRKDFVTPVTGEVLRSPNSLAKRAISTKSGSRDVMAQLFTAICRALDVPARLVFSLQPVDWRAPSATAKSSSRSKTSSVASDSDTPKKAGRGKAKGKGKGKTSSAKSTTDDSGASSWEDDGRKINYKPPPVNLRRTKSPKKRNNDAPEEQHGFRPVWWTEVYERMNKQWITVDPTRRMTRCRDAMAPPKGTADNQLLYVVAYEEDGSVRDVTPRYAPSFTTITMKARVPSKKNTNWFADLLKPYERSFKLNRDRDEEQELWHRQTHEPMPTSISGFKNHPTYVLEQHLKREEAIRPGAPRLGTFKGEEAVYARSSVVELKSAENYWRIGRVIKENEIPMKFVKARNVTINKRREEEARRYEGQAPSQQPLYALEQTELFKPDPVGPDGTVPKNNFGNVDLFVPSMLPDGAAHIEQKSAAKVAKELGVDYAEAITGFEFRQRRAIPVIKGIVVAEGAAEMIREAVVAREEAAFEKELEKRRERVLKRWKKLIQGLKIRQRLQASYDAGDQSALLKEGASQLAEPATKNGKGKKRAAAETSSSSKAKKTKTVKEEEPENEKKKSTSGRTLRFTMSTEERALAKEMAQEHDEA